MTLETTTSVSHRQPWAQGAQNMEASAKMAASAQMVTAAASSLRANMARSSYSNSGLVSPPRVRRSRAAFTSSSARLRAA